MMSADQLMVAVGKRLLFLFLCCSSAHSFNCGPSSLVIGRHLHNPQRCRGRSHLDRLCQSRDRGQLLKLADSTISSLNPSEQFGLSDRFNRWKFLQNILDGELPAPYVNRVIYLVLDGFIKYPRPVFKGSEVRDSEETGSPILTPDRQEIIENLMTGSEDECIDALSDPECGLGSEEIIQMLEKILPDPMDDEDAFKSTWDTITELHGRDMVRSMEERATPDWRAKCVVTRILVYYDFMPLGIVTEPLM